MEVTDGEKVGVLVDVGVSEPVGVKVSVLVKVDVGVLVNVGVGVLVIVAVWSVGMACKAENLLSGHPDVNVN